MKATESEFKYIALVCVQCNFRRLAPKVEAWIFDPAEPFSNADYFYRYLSAAREALLEHTDHGPFGLGIASFNEADATTYLGDALDSKIVSAIMDAARDAMWKIEQEINDARAKAI